MDSAQPGSRRRPVGTGLLVAVLCLALPALARSQGPCEAPAVKDYIDGLVWPRTGASGGPPPPWSICVQYSKAIPPRAKADILDVYTSLRAKPGGRAETMLFQGTSPHVTRELLEGWRVTLHTPTDPAKMYSDPYYRTLLGALALVVLDRSDGLEDLGLTPIRELRESLREGPDWRGVEKALYGFEDVALWADQGITGVTLTGLRDQFRAKQSELTPTDGQLLEIARSLPKRVGQDYWEGMTSIIEGLRKPPPPPPRPTPTPRVIAAQPKVETAPVTRAPEKKPLGIPDGCDLPVCSAATRFNDNSAGRNYRGLREAYRKTSDRLAQRLVTLREGLPEGVDWTAAEAKLQDILRGSEGVERLREGSNVEKGEAEKGIAGIWYFSKDFPWNDLQGVAVYRAALASLLAGDVRAARSKLDQRDDFTTDPRLAAVYVATEYWESGREGVRQACGDLAASCEDGPLVAELRRVEALLGLQGDPLQP